MSKAIDWNALAERLRTHARDLGFRSVGITDTDLSAIEPQFAEWLAEGRHGEMEWMARHGSKRTRPAELEPGTIRVISATMDYWPEDSAPAKNVLRSPEKGYISRYALGRDYHKVMRPRLQTLADRLRSDAGEFGARAFVDSAPVMEKPLAQKAGLGTQGKHTCLIDREAGSWFFLGELYTDLPLPIDAATTGDVCGGCRACINACPTGAITGPYQLDARRCISYLTIELRESIPEELRPLIGNRVYGCDDCQLVCPWNRHATDANERDFRARNGMDEPELIDLFAWTEDEFLERFAGSPVRRIGYECWLRNVAVALGNAPSTPEVVAALRARVEHPSALVREHVRWALSRHQAD
ncbi:MAG: tRNA epoxyqueuosine(34) reductase QueG [Halofilum sp. (in: g-proteobacteria)]